MPRTTRRTTRNSRKKKGNPLIRKLSVLFVLAAIGAGAYWNGDMNTQQVADSKMSQIEEGSVEDKDAVYTETSQDVSDALDTWLKSQDADVTTVESKDRTEERYATGGTISWPTKSKEVVPTKAFTREDLEKQLAKSNGKAILYRVEKTQHNGQDVTEYDIAHFDMLDKEQLYLVTDRLYVTEPKEKTGVVASIKKLIQETTSGSLKDVPQETATITTKPVTVTDGKSTLLKSKVAWLSSLTTAAAT